MELKDIAQEIQTEIKEAIANGPTFGDSVFQILSFNIGKHQTDTRGYRQVLLELDKKYVALKRAQIGHRRAYAQLEILALKLSKETDELQKELIQCDIDEKNLDLENHQKLVGDAIVECNVLYNEFKKFPKFTKEEFESKEKEYWSKRLVQDAHREVLQGGTITAATSQSLQQLGYNPVQVQAELRVVNEQEHRLAIENATRMIALENKASPKVVSINKAKEQ